MAVYKDIDVEFEVRTVNGTVLGVFHVRSDLRVKDLRQAIAERTGSCEGSCELIIDNTIAMDFSLVGGISLSKSRVEVTLVRKKPVLVNPADCSSFCAECLIDAGASVTLILRTFVDHKKKNPAVALYRAGFTLVDVIKSRAGIPELRHSHPPPSSLTLFDSQLKLAGYGASHFRRAGYTVCALSEMYFHNEDQHMTPGDRDWGETMAFFTCQELLDAGFDAEEVRFAFDLPSIIGRQRALVVVAVV